MTWLRGMKRYTLRVFRRGPEFPGSVCYVCGRVIDPDLTIEKRTDGWRHLPGSPWCEGSDKRI